MHILQTALLAVAMSTDAFAAAIGKGTALQRPHWSEAVRTGLIFGVIEAITPLVGYAIGSVAAGHVAAWGPWIAFVVLAGLGGHLFFQGLRGGEAGDSGPAAASAPPRTRHGFMALALTGLATSIDAMAVGAGLSFASVDILPVAAAIGATTFAAVTAGVMLGRWLGERIGRYAEAGGGVVLVGVGVAILAQHLASLP